MHQTPAYDSPYERVLATTFVRSLEFHQSLASTNDRARHIAADLSVARPCLIIAEEQTAGRGRGGNRWWSSPGALTCSLLIEPVQEGLPVARWPEISLTVGAAICAALIQRFPAADVRLKWPNDVYITGRKACGILIEIPSTAPEQLIVGMGLNINNSASTAPPELQNKVTSLSDVAGHKLERADVLCDVLVQLQHLLRHLVHSPEVVRSLWRRYDLLAGGPVTINTGNESIHGTCAGIEDDGSLLMQSEAGLRSFYGGVIESFDDRRL